MKQQLKFEIEFFNSKKQDLDWATIKADSIKEAKQKLRDRFLKRKIRISKIEVCTVSFVW